MAHFLKKKLSMELLRRRGWGLYRTQKTMQHLHDILPNMFDCWDDPTTKELHELPQYKTSKQGMRLDGHVTR